MTTTTEKTGAHRGVRLFYISGFGWAAAAAPFGFFVLLFRGFLGATRDTDNMVRVCSSARESESIQTYSQRRAFCVVVPPSCTRNENLTERARGIKILYCLNMLVRAFSVYGPRRGTNTRRHGGHAGSRDRTARTHTHVPLGDATSVTRS